MLTKFEDDSKLGHATNTTENQKVIVQVKGTELSSNNTEGQ